MRIFVVGTGGVGSAFAAIAQRRSPFVRCALSDVDPGRPEAAVAALDDLRFSARRVDASRTEDVVRLIRKTEADAVLVAVDPVYDLPVFEACLGPARRTSTWPCPSPSPIRSGRTRTRT